jgi:hypothetical protein
MNLPTDVNTIIALVIIVVIIVLYYSYYFVKDMMHEEIKDFYVKSEKIKIKKDKKDKEFTVQKQNEDSTNKIIHLDDFNFDNLEIESADNIDNMEIESFIDPVKNKEQDQNQILSNRIFNI